MMKTMWRKKTQMLVMHDEKTTSNQIKCCRTYLGDDNVMINWSYETSNLSLKSDFKYGCPSSSVWVKWLFRPNWRDIPEMTPISWCSRPSENEMSREMWLESAFVQLSFTVVWEQIWIMKLSHLWMKERKKREMSLLKRKFSCWGKVEHSSGGHTLETLLNGSQPPLPFPPPSSHLWKRLF